MIVSYIKNDNTCYNSNDASIIIENIEFTANEQITYGEYTILWYGNNVSSASISSDGTSAEGLPNGVYYFQISSLVTDAVSDVYTVIIESPNQLQIESVKSSYYSCIDKPSYVYIKVTGGVSPYTYNVGPYLSSSDNNVIKIENIPEGIYGISVIDNNNCVVEFPNAIEILSKDFAVQIDQITSPTLLDGICSLTLSVTGNGPFSLSLIHSQNDSNNFYIDLFETKYLISNSNNTYTYKIEDKIYPGDCTLTVKNSFDCAISLDINVPNINPMSVEFSIVPNNEENAIILFYNTLPIFDTILVPYKIIQESGSLWDYIKNLDIKDNIKIKFDDTEYSFKIVRNILNKYCLSDNKLEILRLGKESKDWFYYFHISKGININDTPGIVGSMGQLFVNDISYPLTLGLSKNDNVLDTENISLIRGSIFLSSIGYPELYDSSKALLSIEEPESADDYLFYIENLQKNVLYNFYTAGPITIIDFLNRFNVLNEYVNLDQSYCEISQQNYRYLTNIKNLINAINDFENLSKIYIYNKENFILNSSVNLYISGNEMFALADNQNILTAYSIQYYYFDQESDSLKQVYKGASPLTNELLVNNLPNGYYIVKIFDQFGNIPKLISYDNKIINYDVHFLDIKNLLKTYNNKILDLVEYGDIMFYIGYDQEIINKETVPTVSVDQTQLPTATRQDIIQNIIKQTKDVTDTGILNIKLAKQNIRCYLNGPKNYQESFISDIRFENLIPGVYTIFGDEKDLTDNNCYQNYFKIFVTKGSAQDISISFVSYENKIYVKDY